LPTRGRRWSRASSRKPARAIAEHALMLMLCRELAQLILPLGLPAVGMLARG
jgi:hypothetical protein